MKKSSSLSLKITKDFCHLDVIKLFRKISDTPPPTLFAITSDIDNLGLYVARYGRAFGQNIVDYCTNVIISFIDSEISEELGKENLVFIPAGEEVSIFGIAINKYKADAYSKALSEFVNRELNLFESEKIKCSVTFGYNYVEDITIINSIKKMLSKIDADQNYLPANDYYEILFRIRTLISPDVDKIKFNDLGTFNRQQIIFLRNVIYSEMLDYKHRTKLLLPVIADNLTKADGLMEQFYEYGISEEQLKRISELKQKLIKSVPEETQT